MKKKKKRTRRADVSGSGCLSQGREGRFLLLTTSFLFFFLFSLFFFHLLSGKLFLDGVRPTGFSMLDKEMKERAGDGGVEYGRRWEKCDGSGKTRERIRRREWVGGRGEGDVVLWRAVLSLKRPALWDTTQTKMTSLEIWLWRTTLSLPPSLPPRLHESVPPDYSLSREDVQQKHWYHLSGRLCPLPDKNTSLTSRNQKNCSLNWWTFFSLEWKDRGKEKAMGTRRQ